MPLYLTPTNTHRNFPTLSHIRTLKRAEARAPFAAERGIYAASTSERLDAATRQTVIHIEAA